MLKKTRLLGLLTALLFSCSDDPATSSASRCIQGKVEPCPCASSAIVGTQTCEANGSFGACLGCPDLEGIGGKGTGGKGTGGKGGTGGKSAGFFGGSNQGVGAGGSGQGNQGGISGGSAGSAGQTNPDDNGNDFFGGNNQGGETEGGNAGKGASNQSGGSDDNGNNPFGGRSGVGGGATAGTGGTGGTGGTATFGLTQLGPCRDGSCAGEDECCVNDATSTCGTPIMGLFCQ